MSSAVRAEIQSRFAGLRSSRMRAAVIIPRSPTSATWSMPKRVRIRATCGRHRGGIPGIAGKDLHRHRTAVGGTEQSVGDLLLAGLAVTVVAEGRQGAAPPLQERAGNIVKDMGIAAPEVPVGEALLDPGLALQQPVEHGQHLVAGDGPEIEYGPEAGRCGLGRQRPGGGELGGGIDDARDNGGDGEITHAVRLAVEDAHQAQGPERSQHRCHMSVGNRPLDGEDLVEVPDGDTAPEEGIDSVFSGI